MSSFISSLRGAADSAAERFLPGVQSVVPACSLRTLGADVFYSVAAGLRPRHVGGSGLAGATVFGGLLAAASALEVQQIREDHAWALSVGDSETIETAEEIGITKLNTYLKWAAPVIGVASAALWPVNVKANDWLDARLRRWGVASPALVMGLATFAVSRGARLVENALEDADYPLPDGEPTVVTLPPEILDLLQRIADPAISPLPQAAEQIQKQLRTASFTVWTDDDEGVEDGALTGDALLNRELDFVSVDNGNDDVGPIVPRSHTYPVRGRVSVDGTDYLVELMIENGWLREVMFFIDWDEEGADLEDVDAEYSPEDEPDLLTVTQWAKVAEDAQIEVEQ